MGSGLALANQEGELGMAKAIIDTASGRTNYYHPDCAPDTPELEEDEVNGMVCSECGAIIEDDEDEEDPKVHEDEEEDGG